MIIWFVILSTNFVWGSRLHKSVIRSDKARCNDYSKAVYYIHHTSENDNNWVVYFESGGGCSSSESCTRRYKRSNKLMSSSWLDGRNELWGRDILSKETENPYRSYNHVYVPYCSSDMYVGMNTYQPQKKFNKYNPEFLFAGYHIVTGLVADLRELYGRGGFNDVVLAGSSAGGIGVMNHIALIREKLKPSSISGIVDSAWFINFEGNFEPFWDYNEAQKLTDYQSFPSNGTTDHGICSKMWGGMPCCFRVDCLNHHGAFEGIKMLYIVSKYDIYLLQASMVRKAKELSGNTTFTMHISNIADVASTYSGSMFLSINSTLDNDNNSYFITNCMQHVYLAPSSLWDEDGELHRLDVEGFKEIYGNLDNDLPLKYHQTVTPGTWLTTHTGRPIYPSQRLVDNIARFKNLTKDKGFYVQDGCVGLACNPTCPEKVDFVYSSVVWEGTWNYLVMAFIGGLTLVCVTLKIFIHLYLVWLKHEQNDPLSHLTESFIPVLGPQDMLSVSCVELTHSIMYHERDTCDAELALPVYAECPTDIESKLLNNNTTLSNKPKALKLSALNSGKRLMEKKILDKVSVYFNPSSFVGIMGPSGSGKTTLLDIITGRRELSERQKNKIYVDGEGYTEMKEEFRKSLAYVLQLERPYYDALTVRENLTFEALMRLPGDCPLKTVFSRVETVMHECGLKNVADTVVGGDSGGGLSGGQKRRLCVALQLIDYPSIIFLDEPTSGLDATSSYDLISMLSQLQISKRCIVITIHQPRQEIFHLFTHILLLAGGKVAYYGSPIQAKVVIEKALQAKDKHISDFLELESDKQYNINIADMIMDLLNNKEAQQLMIDYYEETESRKVKNIIKRASNMAATEPVLAANKLSRETGGFFRTIFALEARIMIQQTLFQMLYLPTLFVVVPGVLGYVYYKLDQSLLLISVYCVVTCLGPLFLTSIIINLISDTLRVFLMQYRDGIGSLYHVVFMVFYRMVAITSFPITICSAIIYFLVNTEYLVKTFLQVTLILLALCQAWCGIFTAVVYSGPSVALRVCPMVAALSAFTSGFLVPEPSMPPPFWALFYLNPTFWSMKGIAKLLLGDRYFGCEDYSSKLACQTSSGNATLVAFGFIDGNPIHTGLMLLLFIFVSQLCSIIILVFKYSPDPLFVSFCKFIRSCRCKQVKKKKVNDVSLVINYAKEGDEMFPQKQWAEVIRRVIQQKHENKEEIFKRVIQSEFLEGIGHFVYKRGTNSEQILERHNQDYRNQNGVTDEMLSKIIKIMKEAVKSSNNVQSVRRNGSSRRFSLVSEGTTAVNRKTDIAVLDMLNKNRRNKLIQANFQTTAKRIQQAQKFQLDRSASSPANPHKNQDRSTSRHRSSMYDTPSSPRRVYSGSDITDPLETCHSHITPEEPIVEAEISQKPSISKLESVNEESQDSLNHSMKSLDEIFATPSSERSDR